MDPYIFDSFHYWNSLLGQKALLNPIMFHTVQSTWNNENNLRYLFAAATATAAELCLPLNLSFLPLTLSTTVELCLQAKSCKWSN